MITDQSSAQITGAVYHITGLITGTYTATAVLKRKKNNITNTYTILYHVTVINKPVVTSITIPNTLELSTGNTYTFSPVIAESGASTTLTWTSTKPSVVAITSAGQITALSPGQSTIMCSAANGVTAQCLVTVTATQVNSVQLNSSELELHVGDHFKLTATVLPDNATNKALEWSSSNENVALVEGDGTIRATGTGYCSITARSTDGSNKMTSCNIHVVSTSSLPLNGDVNADGNISIVDVTALIDYLLSGNSSSNTPNVKTYNVNGLSFTMVDVAGGTFTMGATPEQEDEAVDSEKPAHQVTLSSFSIGQTEVTQALWLAVMGTNPSTFTGNLQNPVDMVSWDDCQEFITQLNALTGLSFRLPTEAEWEYAARGGNKSQGTKYAGSSILDEVAWYPDNSNGTTHPVATKSPNELGLYDMSGNVFEWCQDWFGEYSSTAQTNPTGPESGTYKIQRGGSFRHNAGMCRVSRRSYATSSNNGNHRGLRLAL